MSFALRPPGRPSTVVAAVVAVFALSTIVPLHGAQQGPHGVRFQYDVRVPMRDGVELSTDLYLPDAPGPFPVILVRTPYDNGVAARVIDGKFWASHGYVYAIQDVRGRGDSDGEFYPLVHEAEDGYDAQTWAGTQPWSTGNVGTTGGSYLGWTQVYPAGLANPYLAAMISVVTPPDPLRNLPYRYGAIAPALVNWLVSISGHTIQDISQHDLEGSYHVRPLRDTDLFFGRRIQAWRDWLDHPTLDDYWRAQSYQDNLMNATAPTLHISGWYDDVLVGTTENYVNLSQRAADPAVRRRQHLVIGPWGHQVNTRRRWGRIDFGPEALVDLRGRQLRWFDRWLKGEENGIDDEPPVRIFVMGDNVWRDEQEWPLARTRYTKFYLHSAGRANSRFGDGTLSTEPPDDEPADTYRYDPSDPTPFITEAAYSQLGGPDDYRAVERRDDVLVYSGPVLTEPLEVCGPLTFKLYAASSARDTDWIGRVLDVHPDGFVQRLNEGLIRARLRNGLEHEVPLTPGRVEAYDIDAWSTCKVLGVGHRLRIEIASAAFPLIDANLNTGGPIGDETDGVVAEQTVFHDRERASYVVVPVIPR
jgi:putative CocE/NonD family hydrolase